MENKGNYQSFSLISIPSYSVSPFLALVRKVYTFVNLDNCEFESRLLFEARGNRGMNNCNVLAMNVINCDYYCSFDC